MKTKISSVVTALAIAMTLFVLLAIMASADDYTLTCNGEPFNEGDTLHSGDVIELDINLWIYVDYTSIYIDDDGLHTFTLPGTNTEYTVTEIDTSDLQYNKICLFLETVTASADSYTLTCNGAQIEIGDTLHSGDVIESDIDLWIYVDYTSIYIDDDGLHTFTLPGTNTEYTVAYIDTDDLQYNKICLFLETVTASADSYTLTCNGEPIELGGTLHSGDVITASVDELWIKLNSESWIYTDSDRQHTFTLPGTNTEYTVTWIDIDIESDEIHLYIVEAVPASEDGYTLTCNGDPIEVGDTLHTGDVIESDIELYINLGGNGWLYEDEDGLHTYTLPGDNTEFTVTGIDTSWLPGEIDLIIDVVTNPPSTAEISIDDVDAYIDNQGYGHLRVISQVLFDGKDAEYYGAWFIPADLQIDDNYEKAQVTVSAEIASGDTFASDLRNIPAGSLERTILVIPFIKLFGEENLATTYGEINVLDNLNETSR